MQKKVDWWAIPVHFGAVLRSAMERLVWRRLRAWDAVEYSVRCANCGAEETSKRLLHWRALGLDAGGAVLWTSWEAPDLEAVDTWLCHSCWRLLPSQGWSIMPRQYLALLRSQTELASIWQHQSDALAAVKGSPEEVRDRRKVLRAEFADVAIPVLRRSIGAATDDELRELWKVLSDHIKGLASPRE